MQPGNNKLTFAHVFVSFNCRIADLDNPRDRIVQVCRWYLSAYHAGRKSAVAKKPYNPILGEIFQCYWDIPGEFLYGIYILGCKNMGNSYIK